MDDSLMKIINNAALLLTLSIVYDFSILFLHRLKKNASVINGLLIGLIGMLIMTFHYEVPPGLMIDTRSILISVTALTFGFVPAAISAGIMIVYRIYLGGMGVFAGILIIFIPLVIGLLARRFFYNKAAKLRWLKLYAFGVVVHLMMMLCLIVFPQHIYIQLLPPLTVPIMLVYPLGVVLIALLLIHQREYNEAAERVAAAEKRYENLFNNNHTVMLILEPEDGRIVEANPAAAAHYGWSQTKLKSMDVTQISTLPPEEIKTNLHLAIENKKNHFIHRHKRASGELVEIEIYLSPVEYAGRIRLFLIVHDISVRKAAEKALRESEKRFRMLIEYAPEAIFVMVDSKFAFVNNACLDLLGAKSEGELLGLPGNAVLHPDCWESDKQRLGDIHKQSMMPRRIETVYIRLDKSNINVDISVIPITFNGVEGELVFARDITEKKRLQKKEQEIDAQLRQQQKLKAIGTLAGGVAHEINNPLTGIMNYAQLIADVSEKDSSSKKHALEIIHETDRISVIVKNLLHFSRYEKSSHSNASIYDIVGNTLSLVNTIIKKDNIRLDIKLDDGLPDIKCRSQQIQQVLMNLLTNARDALNEKYPDYSDNKVILVNCVACSIENTPWLRLTVTDYGNGIPEELRERIFEPFFSTKPKEIGTGLGLSISYGIVSEHHGRITFESAAGRYAKFILELPVDNGWTI